MKIFKGAGIVYEDNHIIVVNKPAGMLSQGDKTGDSSIIDILKEYIKIEYNKPGNVFLGSVHRLDRPVSGLMVFARTSKALTRLTQAMKERKIHKRYYAIVEGTITKSKGKLIHFLDKDRRKNIVRAYSKERNNTKRAELNYEVKAIVDGYSLVDVQLLTGRPHQIRVQLVTEFFPIAGDIKYGSEHRDFNKDICLHSYKLEFVHPVRKNKMVFTLLPDAGKCIWAKFEKFF